MKTLNKHQIARYVANNPLYFDFMPQEIRGRLNSNEYLKIKHIQKKFIEEIYEPLTDSEIERLKPCAVKAEIELYTILQKIGISVTEPIKWIVIKAKEGYNWNTCYTQGGVIILSQKTIDKDQNITRTLAHEMIHIFQRKNPDKFRKFYKEKLNFSDFEPTEKQLQCIDDLSIHEIYVNNPDNFEAGLMIYKERFLPITVILPNERQPVNIVLEIESEDVIWKDKKTHQMNAYDKIRLDQPNEMFAYIATKNIN